MARLKFRLTTIHLDDEEDVAGIAAVVRDDTYRTLNELIGDTIAVVSTSRPDARSVPGGREANRPRSALRGGRIGRLRQPHPRRVRTDGGLMGANPVPPGPASSATITRFDEDLWVAVVHRCDHTVGPGSWDEVDAATVEHLATCPEARRDQTGE